MADDSTFEFQLLEQRDIVFVLQLTMSCRDRSVRYYMNSFIHLETYNAFAKTRMSFHAEVRP